MSYRIDDVSFSIGSLPIVRDVTYAFETGSMCSIIGPNGAGKTTLLKLMSGELNPGKGQIYLGHRPLIELPLKERAKLRAVMTQNSVVVFDFLVDEILEMGWISGSLERFNQSRSKVVRECELEDLVDRKFNSLSGGEQQRVQFARALLQIMSRTEDDEDHFLLLDEPTANMDVAHELNLLKVSREILKESVGVVVVLHDLNLAARFSDQIILMDSGCVVASGEPEEVLSGKILSDVYSTPIRVERHEELGRLVVYS
tara:strand:+ start:710 stop:1480 length:771 start_codon:yes stop_codon:yes gene_type:complete